jgi:hypothetical protein
MQRLGVPVAVVEKVLNHVSGSFAGIVGTYQTHEYVALKRLLPGVEIGPPDLFVGQPSAPLARDQPERRPAIEDNSPAHITSPALGRQHE